MRDRKSPGALRLLAFDPGYANLGWAIVRVSLGVIVPEALGVVETRQDGEPGWVPVVGKVAGARAQERRRVEELATAAHLLVDRYAPAALLSEGYSPTRDSSVTGHMAMTWGVLFLEALHRGLPFRDVSPQDLKVALCGVRTAGKRDVEAELGRRYGAGRLRELLDEGGVRWGAREHPYDALAVATVLAAV